MTTLRSTPLFVLMLATLTSVGGCGDSPKPPGNPPRTLDAIVDPTERITDLDPVEEMSEGVANRLNALCDQLRQGNVDLARSFFAVGFVGHDLGSLPPSSARHLPLSIESVEFDVSACRIVDRDRFLEGAAAFLAPVERVDAVMAKVKGAEFSTQKPTWGTLTLHLIALGSEQSGARRERRVTARARCELRGGDWVLSQLNLVSVGEQRRITPLFTEVTRSAGIALEGPQITQEGNDSFFWNGAAAHDIDADGRVDIFVTSQHRNYVYRNVGDGTFEEIAESIGLDQPSRGTGVLFFDADSDGDSDLLLGRVGFTLDGAAVGGPSHFFEHRDDGTFQLNGPERGFTDSIAAFSLAAADVNNDGHLDVHICGYNAEGFIAPNSWHLADNGTPNALYLNRGDGTFENIAARAGVDDRGWSYAGSFADFDRDGDQDLYVANDYGANRLYVNNGDLTFTDRAVELGVDDVGNGMGATWGDEDGDGDLDLYVSNMSSSAGNRILNRLVAPGSNPLSDTLFKLAAGNSIFRWNGSTFDRLPIDAGGIHAGWAWCAQFLDLELDGDEDIVCLNGFVSGDAQADFKDT